ncbi:MAG: hypothetical protein JW882_07350 [Deltaproteobacteria bacterium]|nr:hypothetical protein [Deltaproteobacteria bacterium]
MAESQEYIHSLGELRNSALMLVVANAHICEQQIITKIGKGIYKNAQLLKDDIAALRKKYPGKFTKELETDSIIGKINEIAQSMLQPSEELMGKCAQGKLGRQLESDIKSIAETVKEIRGYVEGKGLIRDKKDASMDLSSSMETIWDSVGNAVTGGLKVFLLIFIVMALAFGYLFFTLESDSEIQKKINTIEAHIRGQEEIISGLESEKSILMDDIKQIEKKDLLRGEKIEVLDLKVKVHSVDEKIQAAETEIEQYKEEISAERNRLEEIKRKSFMERLLRR